MTDLENTDAQHRHPVSLGKRVLQGAGLAAMLVMIFLALGGDPNPGPRLCMLLPLVTVPVGGAIGGLVFYLTDPYRYNNGQHRDIANIIAIVLYVILLLVTLVIGLKEPH